MFYAILGMKKDETVQEEEGEIRKITVEMREKQVQIQKT